jgi:LmbE family N-acetylglucosaminyl deacetylase
MTKAKATEIREAEQRAAVVGVKGCFCARRVMVENTLALRKRLVREIRSSKPEVVVCGDPLCLVSPTYINHPDHRAVAERRLTPLPAGQPNLFEELAEEGLTAHKVRKFMWTPGTTRLMFTSTCRRLI